MNATFRFLLRNTLDRELRVRFPPGSVHWFPELSACFLVEQAYDREVEAAKKKVAHLRGRWVSENEVSYGSQPYSLKGLTIRPAPNTPAALDILIQLFIQRSRTVFEKSFGVNNGKCLVIKYLPANRLRGFMQSGRLYAANTPGFTWGDAVYVTPLSFPFSTMMYGCVGVIGEIHPSTVFDGSDPFGISLYQQWIRRNFRWYDLLTTTIHSDVANRMLRNRFRTQFGIDCVFFRPDQFAPTYVRRSSDRWLALSHWIEDRPRRVGSGPSGVVEDAEFCLVVSEEFDGATNRFVFRPLLGDELRRRSTQPIAIRPGDPAFEHDLRRAYSRIRGNRTAGNALGPVLVTHEIP